MNKIVKEFMKKTKMLDINNQQVGVEEMVTYLTSPKVIDRMVIASEMRIPILTLVAKDLEEVFDENSNFPVVVNGKEKNATNRQNVGRIIKYIMKKYGYTPVDGGLSEQARIPTISGSKYFSTSGIYKKTQDAEYKIEIINTKLSCKEIEKEKDELINIIKDKINSESQVKKLRQLIEIMSD